MIKTIDLLVRRGDFSHDEFMHYWTEVHAPRATGVGAVKGYILDLIVEEHIRPDIRQLSIPRIDGIQAIWWENLEARHVALSGGAGKDWFADRRAFVGQMKTLVMEESPIIPVPSPRPAAKNNAFVNRKPHFSLAEFYHHWIEGHGPMGKEVPYLKGFVPNKAIAELGQSDVPIFASDEINGVAQAYYDSVEEEQAMIKTPQAKEWFKHGAATFGLIKPFAVKEKVIVQPAGA